MKKSKRAKITKQMQRNPDRTTSTPTDESPAIREAREQEAKAAEQAESARARAAAAQARVEAANAALTAKQSERDRIKGQSERLKQQVSNMSPDHPEFRTLSGEGWGLEQVLTRLEGECGGLQERLAVAEKQAQELCSAAEVASASLRNAQRWVRLQEFCERFPALLDQVLGLVEERNRVLGEADQDSHTYQLARVGRARLLPRQDQIRKRSTYELAIIVGRHAAGLAIAPSAPFAAFSMGSGDGGGEIDAPIEPDDIPNPEDLTEEEWLLLTTGAARDE